MKTIFINKNRRFWANCKNEGKDCPNVGVPASAGICFKNLFLKASGICFWFFGGWGSKFSRGLACNLLVYKKVFLPSRTLFRADRLGAAKAEPIVRWGRKATGLH